ncbi:hypothetical protein PGLA_07795 [Paenibacillus glacialis]|uniref:Uncharacterized protein n=1 Tax=Paenibacillus glacialis TaxID=494026 RepID=A0A168MDH9_9BACL|nr:hypothetical protein PGLA_07795 [Paenibacillus glacialis]
MVRGSLGKEVWQVQNGFQVQMRALLFGVLGMEILDTPQQVPLKYLMGSKKIDGQEEIFG